MKKTTSTSPKNNPTAGDTEPHSPPALERPSITIEILSFKKHTLKLIDFPDLSSAKNWIQKGINTLKKHAPKVMSYLSRQHALSQLHAYKILVKVPADATERKLKHTLEVWFKKERGKRLIYVILEGLVLPVTPFLMVLPGPNVFFYVPAMLLYYHLRSYIGLKRVDINKLDLEIILG
ncbi:MAG: hypothetical protein GY765_37840 [bacterium]|nr:hypothetical protein [bacterium]